MIYQIFVAIIWICVSTTIYACDELRQVIAKAKPEHFLCIDGGGTKTSICLLDQKGQVLPLKYQQEKPTKELIRPCSNITVIGMEGVSRFMQDLFANAKVQTPTGWVPLEDILSRCFIVAGFAGAEGDRKVQVRHTINQQRRVQPQASLTYVGTDIDIFMMAASDGIFLIAGTGTNGVCKVGDQLKGRGGGDHWLLGSDQGGGVTIAQEAIRMTLHIERNALLSSERKAFSKDHQQAFQKAVLGFEGYKDLHCPTALELRNKILTDVKTLNVQKLTDLTPLIMQLAYTQDNTVARAIMKNAARGLKEIVDRCATSTTLPMPCPLYLYGGLFKAEQANAWIKDMALPKDQFVIHNMARDNVAIKVIQLILSGQAQN